jgi:ABC-type transporter Mla maintaining outer membrane lipid asymmetry ATPase subunit MlaF
MDVCSDEACFKIKLIFSLFKAAQNAQIIIRHIFSELYHITNNTKFVLLENFIVRGTQNIFSTFEDVAVKRIVKENFALYYSMMNFNFYLYQVAFFVFK